MRRAGKRRSRAPWFAALCLAGALATGCGGQAPAGSHLLADIEWARFVSNEHAFSIRLPAHWPLETGKYGAALTIDLPETEFGPMAHLTITAGPWAQPGAPDDLRPSAPPTLQDYAETRLRRIQRIAPPRSEHEPEPLQLGGHTALRVARHYQSGPVEYRALTYFLLHDDRWRGYTLVGATRAEHFGAAQEGALQQVLESFRIHP